MEVQVTLEAYADQNRALIHNQRNNEALAICKHILRYFPKQLETYRQMGEAYLNLEDVESAKDMFRRVLSADPEDLIAYIGLSTVFEQHRLYEEAIWHLERAYELAPENIEIQKELLRLYPEIGMRIQARVQMTPGALARLYAREGLYPQAIQELRLILAQSPLQFDANVALAETLWNAGRLREAAEVCEKLLAALPYCLKANLILGAVWKESGVPEGDLHLQRAQEVDPTNLVAQKVLGTRSPLPVLQVTVPRYVEGAVPTEQPTPVQPTASSASFTPNKETGAFAETTSAENDFFATTPSLFDTQPTVADTTQTTSSEKLSAEYDVTDLPDWLTSETVSATETTETAPAHAEETLAPSIGGTATDLPIMETSPAAETSEEETPEWLKGWQVVPEESAPTAQAAETTPTQRQDLPDWLHELQVAPKETKPPETVEPSVAPSTETPDWLRGLQPISEPLSAPVTEEKPTPPSAEQKTEPSVEQSFADFLSNLGQEPTTPSEPTPSAPAVPDFPKDLPTPVAPESQPTTQEYHLPSFLNEVETTTPAIEESAAPSSALPLPDFRASPSAEEKPATLSESPSLPSLLQAQEPIAPAQPTTPDFLTSPTEELIAPAMPPEPSPVDAAPAIVIETPPAPVARVRKPKRATKGTERLAQAREYLSAHQIDQALVEYDYIVQRAPRLIKEVIDDLEVWVQRLDAPLEAHRILGDAYTRSDRLNDALERYRYVMEHSPKASG